MKFLIPVTQPNLDSPVDHRLGRGEYWLVVESETMSFEPYKNDYATIECGAGVQAARFALEHEVDTVLAFDFGPKAFAGLNQVKINMFFTQIGQTAREAIQSYLEGKLKKVTTPSKEGHGMQSR